jgi:hypothetical protein
MQQAIGVAPADSVIRLFRTLPTRVADLVAVERVLHAPSSWRRRNPRPSSAADDPLLLTLMRW